MTLVKTPAIRALLVAAVAMLAAACGGGPSVNAGNVSDASGDPAPGAPAATTEATAGTPTWGQRYTWDSGLAVEVAPPAPCKPSQYSSPQNVERAVSFTIVVINGSKEPFRAGSFNIGSNAQFNGKAAEQIVDFDGPCGDGIDSATVLPGKTFTGALAFAVGAAAGEFQLSLQPGLLGDEAVYVGPA